MSDNPRHTYCIFEKTKEGTATHVESGVVGDRGFQALAHYVSTASGYYLALWDYERNGWVEANLE